MPKLVSILDSECGYIENKVVPMEIKEIKSTKKPDNEGYWQDWYFKEDLGCFINYDNDLHYVLTSGTKKNIDIIEINKMDKYIRINQNNYAGPNEAGSPYITSEIIPDGAEYYLIRKGFNAETAICVATLSSSNNFTYRDNSIEQGEKYTYYVSTTEHTDGESIDLTELYPSTSGTLEVDFEDVFLSDATHSLRIRFNPKVTSFKTTIQEQKIDTIGGRFPFFVRNGNLKYKEFPIGGLISYEMDDEFLFYGETDRYAERANTPQLTTYTPRTKGQQVYKERKYKLAVEQWLTNGEPKLFRSPQEGNYVVRLMNISLSPEEKLSRLLHSFTATAYQVADYTPQEMQNNGVWPSDAPEYVVATSIATNTTYGIVKGSEAENYIYVTDVGTMRVNTINLTRITQGADTELVLDGGTASDYIEEVSE